MHEYIHDFVYTCTGDITQIHSDAIVNAANRTLLGGGGVDGAIHKAAGPALLAACKQLRQNVYPEGLPTGQAVETAAGRLNASYVIHTVGPVWSDGSRNEEELLRNAYENCLKTAERLGCKTIAFPAISTGVYGFPKKLAASIVQKVLNDYKAAGSGRSIEKVYLIFFSKKDERTFLLTTKKGS
jgi:O-acetyl-ADP-ribose deacetylase (regulator of RNase III)